MFDQILQLVKEHLSNDPQIAAAIPADKQEVVHQEVTTHVVNGLQNQAAAEGGTAGLLSMLKNTVASGNPLANAIEGGLIGSLTSRLGLSPAITGAIAGALPGILQRFAHKVDDPNDNSITPVTVTNSLGGFFNQK